VLAFIIAAKKCSQEIYRWWAACYAGAGTCYTKMGCFQSWQLAPSGSQHWKGVDVVECGTEQWPLLCYEAVRYPYDCNAGLQICTNCFL